MDQQGATRRPSTSGTRPVGARGRRWCRGSPHGHTDHLSCICLHEGTGTAGRRPALPSHLKPAICHTRIQHLAGRTARWQARPPGRCPAVASALPARPSTSQSEAYIKHTGRGTGGPHPASLLLTHEWTPPHRTIRLSAYVKFGDNLHSVSLSKIQTLVQKVT